MKSRRHKALCYLIGAVCVGDPRKGLQGRGDHEGTGGGAVLLSLTQRRQRQTKRVQCGKNGQGIIRHAPIQNVSSPCPTPDRTPADGRRAPDSSASSSPSAGTCQSGPGSGETASETALPAGRTVW